MKTDTIVKTIVLKAPLARVWAAISSSERFGSWFGVAFDGPFVAGAWLSGRTRPTTVDPEIATMQEPYAGARFQILVERIEPMRLFSFRWHPFALDPKRDYSQEPTTLVAFALKDTADGVQLTITESGFDQIPIDRRGSAFAANDGGWSHQTALIGKYLALPQAT